MQMLKRYFGIENDPAFFIKLAALALFVRFCIGASYYNYFITYLKAPAYAFDGEAYSIMGWYIALVMKGANLLHVSAYAPNDFSVVGGFLGTIAGFRGFFPPLFKYGVGLYSYIIGTFYYVFGYAPVLLRFFMSIISVVSAFFAYRIAKNVFGDEMVGRVSFVLMLFMPSFVLYSASLQRDTIINFVIISALDQMLCIKRTAGAVRIISATGIVFISLIALWFLRVNAMMVMALFFVIYLFTRFAFAYKWIAMAAVAGAIACKPLSDKIILFGRQKLTLLMGYHFGLSKLGGFTFKLLPERCYYYFNTTNGTIPGDITFIDILLACFKGAAVFLFEPSPFVLKKLSHIAVLPQMAAWYFVLAFAFIGMRKCFKSLTAEKLSLITLALIFGLTIGLSEANYETLLRHRDMVVPVFIMLAAYGFTIISDAKKDRCIS